MENIYVVDEGQKGTGMIHENTMKKVKCNHDTPEKNWCIFPN